MSEEGLICNVCERFTSEAADDWFVLTICGHSFHNSCIVAYVGLRDSRPCPIPVCETNVILPELRRMHGMNPSKPRTVNTVPLERLAPASRIPDYSFKLILIGGYGVGKTSLMQRYVGTFMYEYLPTNGCEVAFKYIEIGEKIVKLTIWDSAGQERFRTITANYTRNSNGVLVVYSYDFNTKHFDNNTSYWMNFMKEYDMTTSNTSIFLVGNKIDIPVESRHITSKQGHEYAQRHGLSFFETSAQNGDNVDAVFKAVAVDMIEKAEEKARIMSKLEENDVLTIQLHQHKEAIKTSQKDNGSCCC